MPANYAPIRVRVLLIEDEDLVAGALQRLLRKRGWEPLWAVDGVAARDALTDGAYFDVVLSDVDMPRLDGLGLLFWIRENRADLVPRCIFMTGTPDSTQAAEIARTHLHPPLTKPLDHAHLFTLMIAVCAGSGST